MLKQPLFGQDSSPHKTSLILSLIITGVLWILFIIASFFIKFAPKHKEYKVVQIVLDTAKSPENSEKSVVPEQSAVPELVEGVEGPQTEQPVVEPAPAVVEPTPAVVEPVETTPKPAPQPKPTPAPAKKSEPAKKTEPVKKSEPAKKEYTKVPEPESYGTFLDDNIDFGTKKNNPSQHNWDDYFSDETIPETQPQINQKVDKVTKESGMEGSAASTSNPSQSQTSSKSSETANKTNPAPSASNDTRSALSNIKSAPDTASTRPNVKESTPTNTSKDSNGQTSMQMKDGTTRRVIKPVPAEINLSPEVNLLIKEDITVNIEFRVLADGNVPRGEIKITPESALPAKVRDEIYNQLSNWVFNPGSSAASATFEYSIVHK